MSNRVGRRLVVAAAAFAVVTLAGHVLQVDVLTRGIGDLPAMSPHTAVSVLLLACAMAVPGWRLALAGAALFSGGAAIAIDVAEYTAASGWAASPGTGILVALLAVGVLAPRLGAVAAVAGAGAIGVLIALLMDLPGVYEPAGLVADSGVSLPTAISLSLLSAAWLLERADLSDPGVSRLVSWSTRSLVGVVVVLLAGRLAGLERGPVAAIAVFVAAVGPLVAAWRAATTERAAVQSIGDVRSLLMRNPTSAVVLVDLQGRILEASDLAGELLGEDPAALVGTLVEEFVPPEHHDRHRAHRDEYASAETSVDMSTRDVLEFVTRGGERRKARIGLARLIDPDGSRIFAVTLVDVTALADQAERARQQARALQEALDLQVQAAERVRQLEQTKSLLLEAMSHELRTPMAAVLGMSELLATPPHELDAGVDADLRQRLRRQARTLHRRLSALMDLSPAGQLRPPRPQEVTLRELVAPVVEEVVAEENRSIRMVGVMEARTRTDLGQVRRLLDGLLLNACRHAPDGDIRVVAESTDGGLLLAIEDQGPGVAPDRREAIFEAFVTGADGTDPGVGIGLALVRRLAELNGLRCWVEDAPLGGARFVLSLPEAAPTGQPARPDQAASNEG